MSAAPLPPLTRDRAWACVLLNLSVPGWGSLKAGRKFVGFGEMLIVFAGLFMLGVWFFEWMNRIVQSEIGFDNALPPVPADWTWQSGIGLCVVSWIWTVVTCWSLMRDARTYEEEARRNVPPKLADVPKPPKLS